MARLSRTALTIALFTTANVGAPIAWCAQAQPSPQSANPKGVSAARQSRNSSRIIRKNPTRLAEIETLLQKPAQRPSHLAMQGLQAELTKFIQANPKDAYALYVRGLLRFEMKEMATSLADLNAALELDPKLAPAYEQRGCNYTLSAHSKEALQDFDSAITNGDSSSNAYINRGSLELSCGQNDKAVADLTQALALCQGQGKDAAPQVNRQWMPLMLRSDAYLALKNDEAALADIDAFMLLKSGPEPIKAEMQRRRGVALYGLGRYNEAVAALSTALENPKLFAGDKGRTTFIRGACYYKLGEHERAEADRARAIILGFRESGSASSERPVDKPFAGERSKLDAMLKPYIEQARQSLPEVKARYQKGLPDKETLSVTTRIFGTDGRMEQVFVTVNSWQDTALSGILASKVALTNHKEGEPLTVAEADVLDWTIVKADGREEGNLIGKYLDSVQKADLQKQESPKTDAASAAKISPQAPSR